MFEHFWGAYPRKVSRGAAVKVWTRLNPNTGLAELILKAIEAQKEWRKLAEEANKALPRWERIFIPTWKYPATWLNQQCWLDELPPIFPAAKKKERRFIGCTDCGKPFTVRLNGRPYCTRCYDKCAHPELFPRK